jgi:multiple sugar transport system ATP-binding protein
MAQIDIRRVSKGFKSGKVLNDVSLAAESGEIIVIFGPSGAGKTVLLRLIAGVEDLDSGAIALQGRDVSEAPPEARGVGMAFQNFALFPHMSAYDNIASALNARTVSRAEIRTKVEAVAKLLKIGHVMQHAPRELSNGQKQRTALARALVAEPRILLLDDPLRNVDAKLRYEMRLELPSLLKASGSTVLYVTQDYKEAMALGHRIAVLLDGSFVQVATPAEVYRKPATIGVARLFGDPALNLVPATPYLIDGAPVFDLGGAALAMPKSYSHAIGKACVIGIRPESVLVEGAPTRESFPVEVVAVTPLNEKSVLLLRAMDGHELLAAESEENVETRRHGPACARFAQEAILVFDAASGLRIPPQAN